MKHRIYPSRHWRLLLAACILAPVAAACNRESAAHESAQRQLDVSVRELSDSSLLNVPHPEQFPLVTVESRPVADRLGGTCVVTPDVNRMVPVNALGGGRVVELRARLGDVVRKGQTLVVIGSPDLASALSDHQKAIADEALARRQLDRSRLLFDHGTIARKDLETAEDAEQKAVVDLRTTEERVRMLGGDPAHPAAYIDLKAPISGTIVQQGVTTAAGVKSPDNAPNLFTIADLSRVWVLCDVYENDLPRVHVGEAAHVHLNAYPNVTLSGRIGNISQLLDSTSRTVKVRIELANTHGLMRPGMFAVAELESGQMQSRIVVPTSAVLQIHDASWVFVKVGDHSFRRTRVQAGAEVSPGVQEVVAGLSPGEQVVRNALQFSQATEQD